MIEELVLRQHHVAVFVGDMERSIRFYQRCFGFRLCLTGYVEAAHERVAMLKLKDIVLELLSVDEWPTEREHKHPLFSHGKRRRRSAAASGAGSGAYL